MKFMNTNDPEEFFKDISKSSDFMFEVVKIIDERLGLLPYEETLSSLPDDLKFESSEKTLETKQLDNLYKKQFEGTKSTIVAATYNEWKMILCLLIIIDQIKYYIVPVRQVSFFLNKNKAMLELEEFIKKFN